MDQSEMFDKIFGITAQEVIKLKKENQDLRNRILYLEQQALNQGFHAQERQKADTQKKA